MTPKPWRVLSTRTLHQDRWLTLNAERVETGSGHVLDPFYTVVTGSYVTVVPLLPDGRVVCVEQYRHGIGRVVLELPSGNLDPDEAPAACAARELAEETGYRIIGTPEPLGVLWPEPARSRMQAHGFLARVDPIPGPSACEASEDIAVRLVPLAELADSPELVHAVHAALVMKARRVLGG
jgi:8-oxo-dGTP pyrophosphatase MutT (NUDIX family)